MSTVLGYDWELEMDGITYSGRVGSVRQAYKVAKKTIRRHKKMQRLLGNE
jgi:hypothetical protein